MLDQHSAYIPYDDFLSTCGKDHTGSDGQRIDSAVALRIVTDLARLALDREYDFPSWTANDIDLAFGVIAAIRAQRGCDHYDPSVRVNGGYMTHLMDLIVYG